MTPKVLAAHSFIAQKRRIRELSERLAALAVGNCGDGKKIKDQLKAWEREL